MSADNGIYIAQFSDGFRVIEASAIDNLTYFPEGSAEEKLEWKNYFGNAPKFNTKEQAFAHAQKIYKEFPYLEYGICDLGQGIDW
jgi:hypothetical protein